ncbi:MAG: hypothetical protein WCC94_00845, partial [Candidatus Bathyarchaeia archaeon]
MSSNSGPHRNQASVETFGIPSVRSDTGSGSASQELENLALRYANEAIQYDRQGSKGMAVSHYQRACEVLLK